MFRFNTTNSLAALSLLLSSTALIPAGRAQTVALPQIDVTARQDLQPAGNHVDPSISSLPANIPAVVEERSGQDLRDQVNAVTSAELLKYFPSIEVRERAIGDRNGVIATRTTGTVSSGESILYADDQLLSNFLGNSYSWPPRWALVSPIEVSAVDVIYGPFSALYPGNAMGGVVTLSTRMPEHQEAHVQADGSVQAFKLYGYHATLPSAHVNAAYGDKIGKLAFWLIYDHLDAQGQPLNFATQSGATPGGPVSTTAAKATDTVVRGARFDVDQNGNNRAVFGAYSIDHSIQDTAKIKAAVDFSDDVTLTGSLGLWTNDSNVRTQSFLTTAAGQPFYNGNVNIGGKEYKVSGLNPSTADEAHLAGDVRLYSHTGGVFDFDLSSSFYTYALDSARAATAFGSSRAGTNTDLNGSGWQTLDGRGIWRPGSDALGRHEVSFGAHYDQFILNQHVWNTTDWQVGPNTTANGLSVGRTETTAVYLQDVWNLTQRLSFTLGGREEAWYAFGGQNANTTSNLTYPDRTYTAFSPKASLGFLVTPAFALRGTVGKATRFPTVTELFQQVSNANSVIINDPQLKPEQVVSYDVTAEYTWPHEMLRVSLFDEERTNALYSQTDTTVTPNVTQIENIGQVRIRGVELALDAHDVLIDGLQISASVTGAEAKTLTDRQYPAATGKTFPRIPDWRARMDVTYRPDDVMSYSAGLRYAGRAYNSLNNADINPNTFGGISSYLVADMRVQRKMGDGVTLAAGIDNMFDCKYYVSPHPYPQTTAFLQIRWDL